MPAQIRTLAPSTDYTRIADRYDGTRDVPAGVLKACYERLRAGGVLPAGGVVLDAGSGTGQISLTLAEMGYEVRGYDITPVMTTVANRKAGGLNVRYGVADVRRLPEKDAVFDAALASKLFQHVGDWQYGVRELVRVLKPGGRLLLIDQKGSFKSPVREHLAGLAEAAGYVGRLPGVRKRDELAAAILAEGCVRLDADVSDIAWERQITLGEAFDQLAAGIFTEFWSIPDEAYKRLLTETAQWLDAQPGGRGRTAVMRSHLAVEAFCKAGG